MVRATPLTAVLANAFSLNMLGLEEPGEAAEVCVERLDLDAFRRVAREGPLECAIGHESTARLAEELLGVRLDCRRERVEMAPGGLVLVVQLTFRPDEGKVYTYDELVRLYGEGKIAFHAVYYDSC